ncbi:MAG: hypothetical protein HQK63_16695, partial [Desulfamplus sp.]|nr:hypothetical protein [Desulfamplus sp.]
MIQTIKHNHPQKVKKGTCIICLSQFLLAKSPLSDYITTMKNNTNTDKDNKTNWHRLWGLMVAPLFERLKCEVTVEFDLSLKSQLLDMVVVTKLEDEPINFDDVNL